MIKVNFYNIDDINDNMLQFAVIMARYCGKWIFVRHKERATWEIPGGHREKNEAISYTASRELVEETGAIDFSIIPICNYSVAIGEKESYGQLFYSEVSSLGELFESEIGEVQVFDDMPEDLTYPLIQPYLYKKIIEYFNTLKGAGLN